MTEDRPTAVIVSGGWDGHRPQEAAALFAAELEGAGFSVEQTDDLDRFADERLGEADLVVPNVTMARLEGPQERGLLASVLAGTGCAGWHGGMGDAFRLATDYQFMVGGQFVGHPDGIISYTVEISDPDHEITRGLAAFAVTSERYYMHVDPTNHVLAHTVVRSASAPWVEGAVMPVAWTRMYGDGRVFYSSVGHRPEDWDDPTARALQVRGMVWAARRR